MASEQNAGTARVVVSTGLSAAFPVVGTIVALGINVFAGKVSAKNAKAKNDALLQLQKEYNDALAAAQKRINDAFVKRNTYLDTLGPQGSDARCKAQRTPDGPQTKQLIVR